MSVTVADTDLKSKVVAAFDQYERSLNGSAGSPLHTLRRNALNKFAEIGFPTPRHEEWKYTNVAPIIRQDYVVPTAPQSDSVDQDYVNSVIPDGLEADVLVFVNGFYNSGLSSLSADAGVTVNSFNDAGISDELQARLSQQAAADYNGFVALNTALALDGTLIKVDAGVTSSKPILLLNISDVQAANTLSSLRTIVELQANAHAQLIEINVTRGEGHNLQSRVAEMRLEKGARLQHIMLQEDGSNTYLHNHTHVDQAADSTYSNYVIALKGRFVRNDLYIALNGSGSHADMYGLSLLEGKDFVDNHTLVDHKMPHCTSNELYKGIYDDRSVGVFNGKIIVQPDAQKTNAFQSNRNILLSDNASVNTKPQLEIFADDVKCSHGATSGQFDADALFYLRSRGLSQEAARAIMMHAFAVEVLDEIPVEALRSYLEAKLSSSMSFEF